MESGDGPGDQNALLYLPLHVDQVYQHHAKSVRHEIAWINN